MTNRPIANRQPPTSPTGAPPHAALTVNDWGRAAWTSADSWCFWRAVSRIVRFDVFHVLGGWSVRRDTVTLATPFATETDSEIVGSAFPWSSWSETAGGGALAARPVPPHATSSEPTHMRSELRRSARIARTLRCSDSVVTVAIIGTG